MLFVVAFVFGTVDLFQKYHVYILFATQQYVEN